MDVVYIGGGQYKHEGDVLRATPYAAFGGQEGVIGSGDLKVVEGSTPGGFVNVNPGVVAVLGRGPAQKYEMYVAKSEVQESVDVPATDSSGPRSDLIIVRVVDPQDGPAADQLPADPVNGPYAFAERIHDVDPSTTSLADTFATHGVRAGFALARIDLLASTGTVTNSEIVGLRRLASPLRSYLQLTAPPPGSEEVVALAAPDYEAVPSTAFASVFVPEYAYAMDIDVTCKPMLARDPGAGNDNQVWGKVSVALNGTPGNSKNWSKSFTGTQSELWTGYSDSLQVGSLRGQTITLQVMHKVDGSLNAPNGELVANEFTETVFHIQFRQEAI